VSTDSLSTRNSSIRVKLRTSLNRWEADINYSSKWVCRCHATTNVVPLFILTCYVTQLM